MQPTGPKKRPISVSFVVIGRNEGDRLIDCLTSLGQMTARTVYVDSGSHDGSPQAAAGFGACVVDLDMATPFTAARARNMGYFEAMRRWPDTQFIQFIDGDCRLDQAWLDVAMAFLTERDDVAVVFGRRRERFPERSIFNALCDREWDGPPGNALECGGDILARIAALNEVGPYRNSLIAGEEPELCVRLRKKGWTIWRLPAEMTLHDANITSIRQWWKRSVRAGHAFAEVSALHGGSPHGIWKRNKARSLIWAAILPVSLLAAVILHPLALLLLGLYPLQVARLAWRTGPMQGTSWILASLDVLGKFAETQGILKYHVNRLSGRQQRIIEYK